MADNVAITAGSGTSIAADDIAGVMHQRVKIEWGPDNTVNEVDTASGKPLPVQIRTSTGTAINPATSGTAGAASTDVLTVQGITSMTPILTTAQASTNTQEIVGDVAQDAAIGGNPVSIGARASTATPTAMSADGDSVYIWATREGAQVVTGAIVDDAAFTPAVSRVLPVGFIADETSTDSVDEDDAGAARMTLDRKLIITPQPHTQGGLSVLRKVDLDETPVAIKASRGQLYGFYVANRTTSPRYLRFYNIASGSVTVGTSSIAAGPFTIPANATDFTVVLMNFGGQGIEFDTAISMAATTSFADNDTGAPGANDLMINVFYK